MSGTPEDTRVQRLMQGRADMLWFLDQEIASWRTSDIDPRIRLSADRFIRELEQVHKMLSNALNPDREMVDSTREPAFWQGVIPALRPMYHATMQVAMSVASQHASPKQAAMYTRDRILGLLRTAGLPGEFNAIKFEPYFKWHVQDETGKVVAQGIDNDLRDAYDRKRYTAEQATVSAVRMRDEIMSVLETLPMDSETVTAFDSEGSQGVAPIEGMPGFVVECESGRRFQVLVRELP